MAINLIIRAVFVERMSGLNGMANGSVGNAIRSPDGRFFKTGRRDGVTPSPLVPLFFIIAFASRITKRAIGS